MAKHPATQDFDSRVSKQRIDYQTLPDGRERAVLTVSLPGGKVYRFTADGSDAEDAEVSGVWDAMEVGLGGDPYVEGIFGDIAKGLGKAVKAVGKVARDVATSKVFKVATKGLAVAAPALGPLAPAALTAAAAMGTTSKLFDARRAAKKGNKRVAAKLVKSAQVAARKVAPKTAAKLIKIAQDKSAAALQLSSKPPKRKPTAVNLGARVPRQLSKPAAGGGRVTGAQLLKAARSGRVFVVQAAS